MKYYELGPEEKHIFDQIASGKEYQDNLALPYSMALHYLELYGLIKRKWELTEAGKRLVRLSYKPKSD